MQPCLCLAYNGFRRILDTANGLVHGCPENNVGCLRNFRFSIFDHVGEDEDILNYDDVDDPDAYV